MRSTYAFAAVVLGIVAILVVPLPPPILDALLGIDIFGAALIVLVAIRVEEPLEFSAFAPALLVATLYRLALDVSATRLILTQGHDPGAVGAVIPAFGEFVVRGNVVVGLIIFAILVTIQFIVIASGAQRVAEVAARFTLDAMPGKQMAIDADVHAGAIDPETARRKRARVQKEADFYGAMDGAGKFVKGDAVAALIIVGLNLVGGIAVGLIYHGMSPAAAFETFALLSIGNALVTTLPAFLISVAMGLMVTRVAAERSLGADLAMQLFARPDVLRMAGGLLGALAFVPALPGVVFGSISVAAFVAAHFAGSKRRQEVALAEHAAHDESRTAGRRPEFALGLVGVDAIAIDLGADLLDLLRPPNDGALLDRVGEIRRTLAVETGFVAPGVRFRDDLSREPATYGIRVRDALVAQGRLRIDRLLAVGDPTLLSSLGGDVVREPVYGLEARSIEPAQRENAIALGLLVFDPISILGSHLAEVAREHAADLVGRQEFATLIEHLRATAPATLKDIGTDLLPLATAHRAYVHLLREKAWPRDANSTFEAMLDAAPATSRDLAEAARRRIVPAALRRRNAIPYALVATPALEEALVGCEDSEGAAAPDPAIALAVRATLGEHATRGGRYAAVITSARLRPLLAELALRWRSAVEVYSFAELPRELTLEPVGVLDVPGALS